MHAETLVHAAGAIADGQVVDWPSMTATLSSDYERAIADELELVARIAEGHRQLHQLLPESSEARNEPTLDCARWGHLDLLNVVGRGSYGTVYRAWDTRLERLVALKLFHRVPHPEAVMQEGRMLARIRHENVVTVYGADVIDDVAGIWMELVHGQTLDQIVKEQGPMLPREAAAIAEDVARALAAIHGAQLLHCDVKAQNVVREEGGGRVVLMDLGAGRAAPEARDDAQLSDVAGTPRYMAPELFRSGASATRASDLYSLGVLFYYLVTAKFPVDGKSLGELKHAHLAGQVTPLAEARKNVPAVYQDLVTRALSPDPAARPASADEVRKAMSLLTAPPAVDTRRAWPWLAAAAATVAIAAATLLSPTPPVAPAIRSIAVLPIRNLTGDPSKAYVADGLTEVLISNLARIRSIRVPSFDAVGRYRDTPATPAVIASQLGAQLLLAGSISQADSRFRMTVQLIDPSGTALWGDELTRDLSGVMSAQTEIARMVANRLALTLSQEEQDTLKLSRIDPRAQDAYLKGLTLGQSGPAHSAESERLLREAVDIDPGFAAAWAELALAEGRFIDRSPAGDRATRIALMREKAEKAIALDPTQAAGYAALAHEQFYYEWDFPKAEATFREALKRNPSHAFTYQRLSMLLAALGRLDEALALAREGKALEPAVPVRSTSLGILHYYRREYGAAIAQMRIALDISPGFAPALFGLGRIYSAQGRQDAAAASIEAAMTSGRTSGYLVELARVHAAAKRRDDAQRILSELVDRQKQGDGYNLDNLAYIAAAEGRISDAFEILEKARDERMVNMLWIAVDPRVDALRSDARFDRLLKEMRLRP